MEEKSKTNKNLKIVCAIFLIIGIGLLVTGIVLGVKYGEEYRSWHEAWWNGNAEFWDAPSAYYFAFLIPGILITVWSIVGLIAGSFSKYAFQRNKGMTRDAETESQGLVGLINNLVKSQKRVCKYCGTENPQDASKCQSCGAGLSSKK